MLSNEAGNIAGHAVQRYFQKKFPFRPERTYTFAEWDHAKRKYPLSYALTAILVIIYFLGLLFLYGWILGRTAQWFGETFAAKGSNFYAPVWQIYCIPALFTAIATVAYPIEWTQRLLFRDKFALFYDYYYFKQGYDGRAATHFMTKVCTPFILLSFIHMSLTRLEAYSDHITYKSPAMLQSKEYQYNDLNAIFFLEKWRSKDGSVTNSQAYMFSFKNGDEIFPNQLFEKGTVESFISRLAAISGSQVDTIPIYQSH